MDVSEEEEQYVGIAVQNLHTDSPTYGAPSLTLSYAPVPAAPSHVHLLLQQITSGLNPLPSPPTHTDRGRQRPDDLRPRPSKADVELVRPEDLNQRSHERWTGFRSAFYPILIQELCHPTVALTAVVRSSSRGGGQRGSI